MEGVSTELQAAGGRGRARGGGCRQLQCCECCRVRCRRQAVAKGEKGVLCIVAVAIIEGPSRLYDVCRESAHVLQQALASFFLFTKIRPICLLVWYNCISFFSGKDP